MVDRLPPRDEELLTNPKAAARGSPRQAAALIRNLTHPSPPALDGVPGVKENGSTGPQPQAPRSAPETSAAEDDSITLPPVTAPKSVLRKAEEAAQERVRKADREEEQDDEKERLIADALERVRASGDSLLLQKAEQDAKSEQQEKRQARLQHLKDRERARQVEEIEKQQDQLRAKEKRKQQEYERRQRELEDKQKSIERQKEALNKQEKASQSQLEAAEKAIAASAKTPSSAIPLLGAAKPFQNSFVDPAFSTFGKACMLSGVVANPGTGKPFAVGPTVCRPKKRVIFDQQINGEQTVRVDLLPNGALSIAAVKGQQPAWLPLCSLVVPSYQASLSSLVLGAGWRNYGEDYQEASLAVEGGLCIVTGLITSTAKEPSKWDTLITTLPAQCRPDKRLSFKTNQHEESQRVDVLPNGQVHWVSGHRRRSWLSLDGISFAPRSGERLVLLNGWSEYGQGYRVPSWSSFGSHCGLSGLATGPSSWKPLLAVLPEQCRPASRFIFGVISSLGPARFDVFPDGRVLWMDAAKQPTDAGGSASLLEAHASSRVEKKGKGPAPAPRPPPAPAPKPAPKPVSKPPAPSASLKQYASSAKPPSPPPKKVQVQPAPKKAPAPSSAQQQKAVEAQIKVLKQQVHALGSKQAKKDLQVIEKSLKQSGASAAQVKDIVSTVKKSKNKVATVSAVAKNLRQKSKETVKLPAKLAKNKLANLQLKAYKDQLKIKKKLDAQKKKAAKKISKAKKKQLKKKKNLQKHCKKQMKKLQKQLKKVKGKEKKAQKKRVTLQKNVQKVRVEEKVLQGKITAQRAQVKEEQQRGNKIELAKDVLKLKVMENQFKKIDKKEKALSKNAKKARNAELKLEKQVKAVDAKIAALKRKCSPQPNTVAEERQKLAAQEQQEKAQINAAEQQGKQQVESERKEVEKKREEQQKEEGKKQDELSTQAAEQRGKEEAQKAQLEQEQKAMQEASAKGNQEQVQKLTKQEQQHKADAAQAQQREQEVKRRLEQRQKSSNEQNKKLDAEQKQKDGKLKEEKAKEVQEAKQKKDAELKAMQQRLEAAQKAREVHEKQLAQLKKEAEAQAAKVQEQSDKQIKALQEQTKKAEEKTSNATTLQEAAKKQFERDMKLRDEAEQKARAAAAAKVAAVQKDIAALNDKIQSMNRDIKLQDEKMKFYLNNPKVVERVVTVTVQAPPPAPAKPQPGAASQPAPPPVSESAANRATAPRMQAPPSKLPKSWFSLDGIRFPVAPPQ